MALLRQLRDMGIANLVACAQRGDYTMPDELVDAYTKAYDENDTTPDLRNAREVTRLVAETVRIFNSFGRERLILDHIQPSMTELIEGVRKDVELLGRYTEELTVPIGLLSEPEELREAYIRFANFYPRFHGIRSAWAILRGRVAGDPYGNHHMDTGHPLAEIKNLPDIVANWEECHSGAIKFHGRAAYPWPASPPQRMAWILNHGGIIWCPTAPEQRDNWDRYGKAAA